jgi:hypothetical protein
MAEHKFKIGERVYFHSRSEREAPSGPCQIIRRLPAELDQGGKLDADFHSQPADDFRIRS